MVSIVKVRKKQLNEYIKRTLTDRQPGQIINREFKEKWMKENVEEKIEWIHVLVITLGLRTTEKYNQKLTRDRDRENRIKEMVDRSIPKFNWL